MKARLGVILAWVFLLSGCAVTRPVSDPSYQAAPSADYRLIVMQPDIQVAVLTAGGMLEPRQDWTDQARAHAIKALQEQQESRGGHIAVATSLADAGGDPQAVIELTRLHTVVGNAIKLHKYSVLELPTKSDAFDWTLGDLAVSYGQATSYDYALFLHAQDSFASGGRVALQAMSLLSCAVGVCVMPQGGSQIAFASLVDLKTGQIVWFNFLSSGVGDIRTADGAKRMVDELLETMPLGRQGKNGRRKA
jgi:hypothetical protein